MKIDLYCPQPLVVGKVTVSLISTLPNKEEVEEALTQLRKLAEAAEKFRKAKTYLAALAMEFAPREVAQYLRKRAEEEGTHLIQGILATPPQQDTHRGSATTPGRDRQPELATVDTESTPGTHPRS